MRGNYAPVKGIYSSLSSLLRGSVLCEKNCVMKVVVAGLTPGAQYKMKTYHHDTSLPRGGCPFTAKWNGMKKAKKLKCAAPTPHALCRLECHCAFIVALCVAISSA